MPNRKPDIILIHGFRGNPAGLQEVANFLFDDYRVYLPEVPPFGSAGELSEYTPEAYADFLAGYIRQHHLKRPVLAGHSMGSLVAAATAAKYPELINHKLVLMAPIAAKTPAPIAALQPLATALPNTWVSHLTTRYLFVPTAKTFAQNSKQDGREQVKKLYQKALALTITAGAEYASKPAVRASCKFSAEHSLADFDFHQDTLLLAGAHDRLISRRQTEKYAAARQARRLPTKICLIPNSGHLLNYEAPAATADAIKDFLA